MASEPPKPRKAPDRSAETVEREAERRKRLAEALRANLRRRKGPTEKDDDGRSS